MRPQGKTENSKPVKQVRSERRSAQTEKIYQVLRKTSIAKKTFSESAKERSGGTGIVIPSLFPLNQPLLRFQRKASPAVAPLRFQQLRRPPRSRLPHQPIRQKRPSPLPFQPLPPLEPSPFSAGLSVCWSDNRHRRPSPTR